MIEWIVSSSVLVILTVIIRQLFRSKMSLRMRYALWLVVALRLLIPISFFQSSISVLNLLDWAAAAGGGYWEKLAGSGGQVLQERIGDNVQVVGDRLSKDGYGGEGWYGGPGGAAEELQPNVTGRIDGERQPGMFGQLSSENLSGMSAQSAGGQLSDISGNSFGNRQFDMPGLSGENQQSDMPSLSFENQQSDVPGLSFENQQSDMPSSAGGSQQFDKSDPSGINQQSDITDCPNEVPQPGVFGQISDGLYGTELQFNGAGVSSGGVQRNLAAYLNGTKLSGQVLLIIWLAGTAVCSTVLFATNICYRRRIYLSRTRYQAAGDSRLPVYLSSVVRMPCMFGFLHPAVYLTPEVTEEQKTLKHVLCHENTHYRHHDHLWVLVRAVCVCLHWYNPLVWLAAHLSIQDCELACDEETLERLGAEERIDYGRTLLALSVQDGVLPGSLQLSTSLTGRKKQLKERLQMVVRQPGKYMGVSVKALLLMGVVSMIAFTGEQEEFEPKKFDIGVDTQTAALNGVDQIDVFRRQSGSAEENGSPAKENHADSRNESVSDGLGDSALAYSYGSGAANYESVSVPIKLNGENYVLQIFSESVQKGIYRIPRIDLYQAEKKGEEVLQSIFPGKAKPLYILNGYSAGEDNVSRLSYKLEENPLYVKALREFDDLPLFAMDRFLADDNGSVLADSPDGNVLVADLNGDGYEDFCLQVKVGGDNIPYFCYLWNTSTGQFEPDTMIPNVEFDEETQMVVSATVEGENRECVKYYQYDEYGYLQLVRYVEEDRTPGALFPHWDLTYCWDDYSLPAAESRWEYVLDDEGEMPERLIIWSKKALTELYEWSGTKMDTVCFTATEFGDFYFANTPEDIYASRTFYNRCYGKRAGFEEVVEQMSLSTERDVWYSTVIQWNVPENLAEMTDVQVIEWYFGRSALSKGERIEWIRQADDETEGSYVVKTESGNYYSFYLNMRTREVKLITGPYGTYPLH